MNLGVRVLLMFDGGVHRSVQPLKLCETHDEPHLLRARHHVIFGHTEDHVQDVGFHVGTQRREGLELFEQFLFTVPGRIGDEETASLHAFTIPRFVQVFTSRTFRVTI